MKKYIVHGIMLVFAILIGLPGQAMAITPLERQIIQISREYDALISLTTAEQALGIPLGKAAETWSLVAMAMGERFSEGDAVIYLKNSRAMYFHASANQNDPLTTQLAGINLMYQSLDTLAYILSNANDNKSVISSIKKIEQRILTVAKQSKGGAAVVALSGGNMSMLAVIASQVDHSGEMGEIIAEELERRKRIDLNIQQLNDTPLEKRMLLLINNHQYGALSLVQAIGLTLEPSLKGKLQRIEENLVKYKDRDLDTQILEGAKALTETGFLVGPVLVQFTPRVKKPASPQPDLQTPTSPEPPETD